MDARPGDDDEHHQNQTTVVTEETPLLTGASPTGPEGSLIPLPPPPSPVKDVEDPSASPSTHYRNVDRRHFWLLFGGILFGDLIAFFDSTMMASSHPVITSYFDASNAASWLSTVFFLTSTIFQPLAGRISDVVGRKPVYLFAIATFFATTVWCALAQSIGSLIAARAVCGLGAGGVITVSFILVSDVVKIEYRGLYQSYLNMFYGIGHSLGAALGGVLCDRLGWRWAFGVQLPFIFVYLLLAIFTTPDDLGPNLMKKENKGLMEAFRAFDILGSIIISFLLAGLILGLNLGGNVLSWDHPVVITSLVVFAVSCVALVLVERRATRPILPLQYLSTIPLVNLMTSNFFGSIVRFRSDGEELVGFFHAYTMCFRSRRRCFSMCLCSYRLCDNSRRPDRVSTSCLLWLE